MLKGLKSKGLSLFYFGKVYPKRSALNPSFLSPNLT